MKNWGLRFGISCAMLFICLSMSAQDYNYGNLSEEGKKEMERMNTYFQEGELEMYQRMMVKIKPAKKGLHFDFDAGYSPFGGGYKVSERLSMTDEVTGTTTETTAVLKVNNIIRANAGLIYSSGERYIGIGTGIWVHQLEYVENGHKTNPTSYGIPLYLKGGFIASHSENFGIYGNCNVGVLFGTNDLKTSFLLEPQVGVYYGNAKIGIDVMPNKPKAKNYFADFNDSGQWALSVGLFLGFTI